MKCSICRFEELPRAKFYHQSSGDLKIPAFKSLRIYRPTSRSIFQIILPWVNLFEPTADGSSFHDNPASLANYTIHVVKRRINSK
jgi:hypothetical protein